ncbi:dTDP-4-dehydrorhamnose 3,5-epimerase [Pseudohalocynthiibacter sp. F2068]|jgi:dTDP-4-dehydrorhamnose 3,5-epimerase|uniref:dTDP-4-dehydrorhamnose 3,5-epimerase n=1 Tax=Pseudohalocynthiibacter sp. F2068 TaxID=2926418 RepID=UPI001FF61438|nr:dTDP-4-dehydrorhamnose 3,5-epimerase [Pseudohalocynthiibacter sp. F2068]MCK0103879.1 dTDP-4-dehydrorhamnose 3,5-epimerase [Pseudohalocynthiibacter sp. F2068]
MLIEHTNFPDVKVLTPRRYFDDRGFFSEAWSRRKLDAEGLRYEFVQDNESLSRVQGTLRGLHYQSPPFAQTKLVRVVAGAILDLVVDVRKGSPHFGEWESFEISEENGKQLLVPIGFLHGFLTLKPDTHVIYKVDNFYSSECDGAVVWNDPDLGIDWGVDDKDISISKKDSAAPRLADWTSPFNYEGEA